MTTHDQFLHLLYLGSCDQLTMAKKEESRAFPINRHRESNKIPPKIPANSVIYNNFESETRTGKETPAN